MRINLLLAMLFLTTACQGTAAPRHVAAEAMPAVKTGLQAEVRLENAVGEQLHTLRSGERVRFVFSIRNETPRPVTVRYTFPPHRLRIFPEAGKDAIWQAWTGRMFPQVMRDQAIAAGAVEDFVIEWTVPDEFLPGRYRAEPVLHLFVNESTWQPRLRTLTFAVAP